MNITERYQEIPKEAWANESQQMELKLWEANNIGDDWNMWWKIKFDDFSAITNEKVDSIAEVGCGPIAKNIQYVVQALQTKPTKYFLSDPLLKEYVNMGRPVSNFAMEVQAKLSSKPLEEWILKEPVDMIVCINVLDHVYSIPKCMESIYNNLKKGGVLILGNDLTNQEDFDATPKDDPNGMMHPIRFDYDDIKPFLSKYEIISEKVLGRQEGRIRYAGEEKAHYATLIHTGRKK